MTFWANSPKPGTPGSRRAAALTARGPVDFDVFFECRWALGWTIRLCGDVTRGVVIAAAGGGDGGDGGGGDGGDGGDGDGGDGDGGGGGGRGTEVCVGGGGGCGGGSGFGKVVARAAA
jgi:hypothetical protein